MDTTPPPRTDPGTPPAPQPSAPETGGAFFDGLRNAGVVRTEERWIGGVAGGVALRLGIDPLIVRGLLAASVLLGGLGLIAYAVAWALLPEQSDGRIHTQELLRGRFDVAVLGALAVLAAGLGFPDGWSAGRWWGGAWFAGDWWPTFMWLSAIALVVVLVVTASRNRGQGTGTGTGAGPTTSLPRPPWPGQPGGPAAGPLPWPSAPPRPGAGPVPAPPAPTTPTAADAASTGGTTPMSQSSTATTPYRAGAAGGPTSTAYPEDCPPTTPAGAYGSSGGPGGTGGYGGAGGYGGWSGYGGSYGTPAGPVGPVTKLPRTRPAGPGAGMVGVVVALTLLTLAALMLGERQGWYSGWPVLTAGAVGVVLAGLGILISGLRGRTGGSLNALAVLGVIVLLPMAAVERNAWDWADWDDSTRDGGAPFGDVSATPTTVAAAEDGWSLGAGELTLDLTEVPLTGAAVSVPVDVGVGDVTVIIPRGEAVWAEIDNGAGEIRWLDEGPSSGAGQGARDFASPAADDEDPVLLLDISLGAGQVTVREG